MIISYVSLKSVLYKLSSIVPEQDFNEDYFLEYIYEGLRLLNISSLYEDKEIELTLKDHVTTLPSSMGYLSAVVLKDECNFKRLRLSTADFNSKCLSPTLRQCHNCEDFYSIKNLSLTSSVKDGTIILSYKDLRSDEDGPIIPDYEPLKEALTYYALYRHWLMKYMLKEEGAESRMAFFQKMWATFALRAATLNNPSVDQLENLRVIGNRLTPADEYKDLFSKLGSTRYVRY